MAFQKSQADRWRSDREDREGGNVPTGAISGPPSAILALGQTPGVGTAYGALRTSQDGPIFRREIRLNAAPPDRMGEHPSTVDSPPPSYPRPATKPAASPLGSGPIVGSDKAA